VTETQNVTQTSMQEHSVTEALKAPEELGTRLIEKWLSVPHAQDIRSAHGRTPTYARNRSPKARALEDCMRILPLAASAVLVAGAAVVSSS